jgi:6-pyruvoyltetrahydropterin/6-carboxytetrahydropterin synthase
MLQLTKSFNFEMAHAIAGYNGCCKHIHGHSYQLHVTITANEKDDNFIEPPGFNIDFKTVKTIVTTNIIEPFDHKLVLSGRYLDQHPEMLTHENLFRFEYEPTAENMLLYFRQCLVAQMPKKIKLARLKLYETRNSYAEWINDQLATSNIIE